MNAVEHNHTILPCFCYPIDQGTAQVILGQGPMCCVEMFLANKCPRHGQEDNEGHPDPGVREAIQRSESLKKCEHPSELSEEQQQWFRDAATAAIDAFEHFQEARAPLEAAERLVELSNRMFDLSSYLPEFCSEWGWRAHEEEE